MCGGIQYDYNKQANSIMTGLGYNLELVSLYGPSADS